MTCLNYNYLTFKHRFEGVQCAIEYSHRQTSVRARFLLSLDLNAKENTIGILFHADGVSYPNASIYVLPRGARESYQLAKTLSTFA